LSKDYKLMQNLIQMSKLPIDISEEYLTQCSKFLDSREGGIIDCGLRNIKNRLDRVIDHKPA
jgi:hypothetical protein